MPQLTRHRRGYTVAELLMTVVLISAVGLIASRLMLGQQRFFQRTNEQMDMRRELRTALSIVPADLRGISSSGGDLTSFDETSITFRAPIGSSVVCRRTAGPTTQFVIPPERSAKNIVTSWYSEPAPGDTVWAFNDSLSAGAEDDYWAPMRITAIQRVSDQCADTTFIHPTADRNNQFRITVASNLPDSIRSGSALRFTRSLRYRLQAQGSGRTYLTRSEYTNSTWTAPTIVSGHYSAGAGSGTSGIRFAYFDSLGAAITNVADSRRVSRIDLLLRSRGNRSSGLNGTTTTENYDSLAFRIALRNRQ